MWNIDSESPIAKFNHSSVVSCISFCPNKEKEEIFVTGCLDKYIRIWSISSKTLLEYINLKDYITAISFSPTGDMIVVGTHNGKCSVYNFVSFI